MRVRTGKTNEGSAGRVKNFQAPAMFKRHRWTVNKCNLRVKRRDPWSRAKRTVKSGG